MILQCIYHLREAHEIFVTGLEFAPDTVSLAVVGPNVDFTLLSISADSQVKAHQVASRRMFSYLLCIFLLELSLRFWALAVFIAKSDVIIQMHI